MILISKTLDELRTLEANARACMHGPRAQQAARVLQEVTQELIRRRAADTEAAARKRGEIVARVAAFDFESRVMAAFKEAPPQAWEAAAIQVLYQNPGASTEALSKLLGYVGGYFNMAFGTLCHDREAWLGAAPPSDKRPDEEFHSGRLADLEYRHETSTGRTWAAWHMKPEAEAGFEKLGLVKPLSQPTTEFTSQSPPVSATYRQG